MQIAHLCCCVLYACAPIDSCARSGSGQIDFDEFVAVMGTQMKAGGGGFADVVEKAGGFLGFLNPSNWFK